MVRALRRQSTAPAYIGEMSLGDSLDALLRATPLTAHVYVGAPLAPGADRRVLAAEAEGAVRAALVAMQGKDAVRGSAKSNQAAVWRSRSHPTSASGCRRSRPPRCARAC